MTRLSKEVSALRVTGQATQDSVGELSSQISHLLKTKTMESMAVEQKRSAVASSSSGTQQAAPGLGRPSVTTLAHPGMHRRRGSESDREPEAIRTKLVSRP